MPRPMLSNIDNIELGAIQMHQKEHTTLLSDAALAERLGVARGTVWRWVKQGVIPGPVRIGGATRFIAAEIDAAVAKLAEDRDGRAA